MPVLGDGHEVRQSGEMESTTLAPEFAKVVEWLRSGNRRYNNISHGIADNSERFPGVAFIRVSVDSFRLSSEADRIAFLLGCEGVQFKPFRDYMTPTIEAHYDPVIGEAVITLWNVRL